MQDFIQIIQSVGFPIACAVAMFVFLNNEQKSHKEEEARIQQTVSDLKISFAEALYAQQKEVTQAINNNTVVMQKLVDKLGGEESK